MPIQTTLDFSHAFWQNKRPLIDSRSLLFPEQSLFFALKGRRSDGHDYLEELYKRGVRHFVVRAIPIALRQREDAHWVQVEQVLEALQAFAQYHRAQFPTLPLLAITGSNGKTMIKEGLSQLLEGSCHLVKSPKSYNSQIGVPLSVLQVQPIHDRAIFEAGISNVGEMARLAAILRPTLGLFTNLGAAHDSGFATRRQKLEEKLRLFEGAEALVYCTDHTLVHEGIQVWQQAAPAATPQLWGWGTQAEARVPVRTVVRDQVTEVTLSWDGADHRLIWNTTSTALVENRIHMLVVLLYWGWTLDAITERLQHLSELPMRLAYQEGINGCYLIDDSYNNDVEGLRIGLEVLGQKAAHSPAQQQTVLLSDLPDLNQRSDYKPVAELLERKGIHRLIGVGTQLLAHQTLFDALPHCQFYSDTDALLQALDQGDCRIQRETILLKGARRFAFERVVTVLQKRLHRTVLEIDLAALSHNIHIHRQQLHPSTRLMVMVKAAAYGSGAYEVAQWLEYLKVDYLGVAYPDEGVALRQKGIRLPIMVMNTAPHELELVQRYELEPVVYNWKGWEALLQRAAADGPHLGIHLELDTGMHRLGLTNNDLPRMLQELQDKPSSITVKGIFSHLAAANSPRHDAFTQQQWERFEAWSQQLLTVLPEIPLRHLLNSSGIERHPEAQYDMVRLGIGAYGLATHLPLQAVLTLKTTVAQLKTVAAGETVGYSRQGVVPAGTHLAVLSIGYADGFLRGLGNGAVTVRIRGQAVPTVGNVCMDMCFVDVSQLSDVQEGDEVIIFENQADLHRLAKALGTIPYEILTSLSERLPRVFYEA